MNRLPLLRAATLALVTTLALAACGAGNESAESSGSSGIPQEASAAGPPAPEDAPAGADLDAVAPESATEQDAAAGDAATDRAAGSAGAAAPAATEAQPPAIIATGTVELLAEDVGETRRAVQRLADEVGGRLSSEETTADDDGAAVASRLVLRVPSATFDATMTAVEDLAPTSSSSRGLEDVTTQVVDTEARVRAQRESLARVEALLAEADDLGEVVSIEGELTRRQADLDSLASQLAYLQDATSWSTITVQVQRPADDTDGADDTDEATGGFVGGLRDGWAALAEFGSGVATVAGVLLPWAVLALLVGTPLLLLLRRLARRSRGGVAAA
ncbi:DUF4349 domain-containing protein [Nocardioides sp. ChNu-99]|uniref:DUF4349 domain-containing protein n=1 Tax=Nocardioides sp. ChNu-99 TaxID=2839897 RepID=UPI002405616D|nr:DUF4349 domain-containing protein [Nocardioides sp. ChNu-99]MDF9717168.1 DUF4349 domain-containing protein [Nocardioides sp. ChNu-99]